MLDRNAWRGSSGPYLVLMIQNDLEFPEGILEAFLKFGHARQVSGLLAVALGDIFVNTIQLIHLFNSQDRVGFHDGASSTRFIECNSIA
jgi:hypothetical protein